MALIMALTMALIMPLTMALIMHLIRLMKHPNGSRIMNGNLLTVPFHTIVGLTIVELTFSTCSMYNFQLCKLYVYTRVYHDKRKCNNLYLWQFNVSDAQELSNQVLKTVSKRNFH
jgi:hypothetical protein